MKITAVAGILVPQQPVTVGGSTDDPVISIIRIPVKELVTFGLLTAKPVDFATNLLPLGLFVAWLGGLQ
ncbi:MAG TPA: hypothetical protein VFX43_15875 [Chitinophagaceae bacterium]|nr:hypothetical protein [Chitinophagaceae bacterium]